MFDGLCMTKALALAARTGKDPLTGEDALDIVRQSLKGTQHLIRMAKELALAAGTNKDFYVIVRGVPEATKDVVAERSVEPEEPEEPFILMGLPWDVRYKILEQLIGTQNLRVFLMGTYQSGRYCDIPICLPEVARAGSTKLRHECLLVALNKCTVEIHSGPGNARFQNWLSKVDFTNTESFLETGFDAITSLYFTYFSRFPYWDPNFTKNNDVGLATACKNLRSMTMFFHRQSLEEAASRHSTASDDFAAECALDIRESYQLDGLLNATKLEKLHFVAGDYPRLLIGLTEAVAWFNKGFKERKQKVLIEMGPRSNGW
jgi:hypothetical protein